VNRKTIRASEEDRSSMYTFGTDVRLHNVMPAVYVTFLSVSRSKGVTGNKSVRKNGHGPPCPYIKRLHKGIWMDDLSGIA
jgi:hypothetical protein